mmetsp:Transcript_28502/g.41983  ORF Transcript_28502/g.41983 Transcript_28502/m.41983 type:complete len:88 (-) Transcript_28502:8-271(-)
MSQRHIALAPHLHYPSFLCHGQISLLVLQDCVLHSNATSAKSCRKHALCATIGMTDGNSTAGATNVSLLQKNSAKHLYTFHCSKINA